MCQCVYRSFMHVCEQTCGCRTAAGRNPGMACSALPTATLCPANRYSPCAYHPPSQCPLLLVSQNNSFSDACTNPANVDTPGICLPPPAADSYAGSQPALAAPSGIPPSGTAVLAWLALIGIPVVALGGFAAWLYRRREQRRILRSLAAAHQEDGEWRGGRAQPVALPSVIQASLSWAPSAALEGDRTWKVTHLPVLSVASESIPALIVTCRPRVPSQLRLTRDPGGGALVRHHAAPQVSALWSDTMLTCR